MLNNIKTSIEQTMKTNRFMGINYNEAINLLYINNLPDIIDLISISNKVQLHYKKNKIIKCASVNIPPYKCSEDCKFCALSIHHTAKLTKKDLNIFDDVDVIVKEAIKMEKLGADRFKMVAGGKGLNKTTLDMITKVCKKLKRYTELSICASCGILPSLEYAEKMKNSGVDRYNCNFESSKSFFSKLCTTHSYDDKIKSINLAKQVGMDHCGGCMLGLGENNEQRIELAFDIKKYGGTSMPFNILVPISGTPLENSKPVSALELLKFLAIYRLIKGV